MKLCRCTLRSLLAPLLLGAALGCGRNGESANNAAPSVQKTAPEGQANLSKSESTTVKLAPGMLANIKIEQLKLQPAPSAINVTGKVFFNEDRMARILAPLGGQIVNLRAKVGDSVSTGQALFYINSREASGAVTELIENQKDLELAEKNYAMTKDLFDHEAASRIGLLQSENDLAKAKARVARSEYALKVLNLEIADNATDSKIPVQAPLSGKVVERAVTEGQFVQPDSNPLMLIADLTNLWILADVYESDLRLIRLGQKAEATTAAYPNESFTATISRISDTVDPNTRTVKVRLGVANPAARLKPEMFASVRIFIGEATSALLIPATAVLNEEGKNFVYLQSGPLEFTRRQVEAAPAGAGRLKVSAGLKEGDKIVTERALLVHEEGSQQKE